MTITSQHQPHQRDSRPAQRRATGATEVPADDRSVEALTSSELAALPGVLDVLTAARVLGIGRTMAYELVRTDQWPTPVLRVGRLVKIPTAPLLVLLGIAGSPSPRGDREGHPETPPDVQTASSQDPRRGPTGVTPCHSVGPDAGQSGGQTGVKRS